MSLAISVDSVRDHDEGKVDFSTYGLVEDACECAKKVVRELEESIEAQLEADGPSLHINATDDDLSLTFGVGYAFGDGNGIGPAWRFSLKEALSSMDCNSERDVMIMAMQKLIDYLEKEKIDGENLE